MMNLPALEKVCLSDTQGQVVCLGDLWKGQPVILVFLRHFG